MLRCSARTTTLLEQILKTFFNLQMIMIIFKASKSRTMLELNSKLMVMLYIKESEKNWKTSKINKLRAVSQRILPMNKKKLASDNFIKK